MKLLSALAIGLVGIALSPSQGNAHGAVHEQLALLENEIATHPSDPALVVRRATLEIEHEDWQAALVDLEKATRLGARDEDLALIRGQALMVGKQWALARNAFDDFLAAHPPTNAALTERARVLQHLGKAKTALDDYRAALKLTPKPEPDLIIEAATAMVAQGQRDEALQVLDSGIAQLGPVPPLVLKAVALNVDAQRYDDALRYLAPMLKLPRAEPWLARRASVLAQAGRMDESAASWRELHKRILALPADERGAHAMCQLMAQANDAVAALASVTSVKPSAQSR